MTATATATPELAKGNGSVADDASPREATATVGRTRTVRHRITAYDDVTVKELRGSRAIKTFDRMSLDPIIAGFVERVRLLLRAPEWNVEPGNAPGEEPSALDIEFADFVSENFARLATPWRAIVADSAERVVWGFSLYETLFEATDSGIMWADHAPRPQRTIIDWLYDADTNRLESVRQTVDGRSMGIPVWKLLHFRTHLAGGEPSGRSLIRGAFLPWVDKQELRRITKIGLRRDLTGMVKLEVPPTMLTPGATAEEKSALSDAETMVTEIERDQREGIVIPHETKPDGLPSGWRLSLIGGVGRRAIDLEALRVGLNREIATAMIAEVMVSGGEGTGSFAMKQSETIMFVRAITSLLHEVSECMEHSAFPVLRALNPRYANAASPHLRHGEIEEMAIETFGAFVRDMVGVEAMSPKGLDEPLRRRVGLPLSDAGEEEV